MVPVNVYIQLRRKIGKCDTLTNSTGQCMTFANVQVNNFSEIVLFLNLLLKTNHLKSIESE